MVVWVSGTLCSDLVRNPSANHVRGDNTTRAEQITALGTPPRSQVPCECHWISDSIALHITLADEVYRSVR